MDTDIVKSSAAFTGNPVFPTEVGGKPVGASILVTFVGSTQDELDMKMENWPRLPTRPAPMMCWSSIRQP